VVLKPEVVRERLRLLEEVAAELERQPRATAEELEADTARRWVLERGLIAGANLLFDVADHIVSSRFKAHPDTYGATLRELRDRDVITPALYDELQGLPGLRNLLVHLYARIDPAKIAEHAAKAPGPFRRFAADVLTWLESQGL
jgi:uncharacterized protein YutE (UPF0331/DUF86 family)